MRKALNIKKKKKRDNVTTFISKLMSCKKSIDSSYKSKTQYIIICQLHLKFLLQIRNFHRLTLLLFETMLEHIYLPLKPSLSFIISTQESFLQYKIFTIKGENSVDKTWLILFLSSIFCKIFKLRIYSPFLLA